MNIFTQKNFKCLCKRICKLKGKSSKKAKQVEGKYQTSLCNIFVKIDYYKKKMDLIILVMNEHHEQAIHN